MRKIIESQTEAMRLVEHLQETLEIGEDIDVGLVGSYLTGDNKANSKLDIVMKAKTEKGRQLVGSISLTLLVDTFMTAHYHNKYNLIWLDLVEKDTEALLDYMREKGMESNPNCLYTNIVKEVQWVGQEEDEEENPENIDEGDEE